MELQVLASVLLFNGQEKAVRTVQDLLDQQLGNISLKIMVVNNGADSRTAERISNLDAGIELVSPETNGGFAGGNNVAIDRAKEIRADLLLLLNDDVQLPSDYVRRLALAVQANPHAGIFGSTIKLPGGEIQAVGGSLLPFGAGVDWHKISPAPPGNGSYAVDVIQGAAFAITSKVLSSGYRFDERLFFGCEEYDLALWARSRSIQTVVIADVEVIHFTEQTNVILHRWEVAPRHYYLTVRNDVFLKIQHFRGSLVLVPSVLYLASRSILKGVIFTFIGRPVMLRAVILGLFHGLIGRMGAGANFVRK
jgi:GT2 family glycosyltransferase